MLWTDCEVRLEVLVEELCDRGELGEELLCPLLVEGLCNDEDEVREPPLCAVVAEENCGDDEVKGELLGKVDWATEDCVEELLLCVVLV